MSKLQELIQKLCPDGVEYKRLGDVCEIKRGVRVTRSSLVDGGAFSVFQNSLTHWVILIDIIEMLRKRL